MLVLIPLVKVPSTHAGTPHLRLWAKGFPASLVSPTSAQHQVTYCCSVRSLTLVWKVPQLATSWFGHWESSSPSFDSALTCDMPWPKRMWRKWFFQSSGLQRPCSAPSPSWDHWPCRSPTEPAGGCQRPGGEGPRDLSQQIGSLPDVRVTP